MSNVITEIDDGFARMPLRAEGVHWLKAHEWDEIKFEIERLRGDISETRIALANAECREGVSKARLAEAESVIEAVATMYNGNPAKYAEAVSNAHSLADDYVMKYLSGADSADKVQK